MPKHIIQYGLEDQVVDVAGADGMSGYSYQLPPGASLERSSDLPSGATVSRRRQPEAAIVWDRAGAPVAIGEDAEGFAMLTLAVSREEVLACADELGKQPDMPDTVFATQKLSRQQINEAIRALKRARDAAYGKDE